MPNEIVCNPIFVKRTFEGYSASSCFVIMPFGDNILEQIFRDIVKPAVIDSGYDCIRGDDIFSVSSIIEDIWSAICSARFLVGEFTGRNPNVLYEAGLAHTLGKPLICLTQKKDDIPFDLAHVRYIIYDNSPRGYETLRNNLIATIRSLDDEDHVISPRPSTTSDIEQLKRAIVEERRRFTQVYEAIESRLVRNYAHWHQSSKTTSRADGKELFDSLEFCDIDGGMVSVDAISEQGDGVISFGNQRVQPFRMQKFPVTNADYAIFVRTTGHPPPEHWSADAPPQRLYDYPVLGISWVDIVSFCEWLSAASGHDIRIPTEAEWLAASGYAMDGRLYPWGNAWNPDACNSSDVAATGITSVHEFEAEGASPFGCIDMLGNVWEWTSDIYDAASEEGFHWRAVRGGANYEHLEGVGVLSRLIAFPGHFLFVRDLSFRLAY